MIKLFKKAGEMLNKSDLLLHLMNDCVTLNMSRVIGDFLCSSTRTNKLSLQGAETKHGT